MKSLDTQCLHTRFNIDIADRPERHAAAGFESVQHSLRFAVVKKVILVIPEYFRLDSFKLKSDQIIRSTSAVHAIVAPTNR